MSFITVLLSPILFMPFFIAVFIIGVVIYLQVAYLYLKKKIKVWLYDHFSLLSRIGFKRNSVLNFGEIIFASIFLSYNYITKPMMQGAVKFGAGEPCTYGAICPMLDVSNTMTTWLIKATPFVLAFIWIIYLPIQYLKKRGYKDTELPLSVGDIEVS